MRTLSRFLGIDESTIIIGIVLLLLISFAVKKIKGGKSAAIVLKKFSIDENGSDGALFRIQGRKRGLLALLFPHTYEMLLTKQDLRFFDGETNTTIIPLGVGIANINCRKNRYVILLVLAWLSFIGAAIMLMMSNFMVMSTPIYSALLGGIFYAWYYFTKSIEISVSSDGKFYGIKYAPSITLDADFEKAEKAAELINERVQACSNK